MILAIDIGNTNIFIGAVSYTHLRLENTSSSTDGFQRHPQTISSPPPQRQTFAGTKDTARGIGPVHWPAAADCLTH